MRSTKATRARKSQTQVTNLQEDQKRLYESDVFNQNSPKTLQNKVFFEIMLYFCRRGRQNLRKLKKTDFSFCTDGKGARYVYKTTDELTKIEEKTIKGLKEEQCSRKPGYTVPCPVALFEKYLQHLNPKFLFQRPTRNISPSDQLWYDNMVIGERSLGNKMKKYISWALKVLHQPLNQGNSGYYFRQLRI